MKRYLKSVTIYDVAKAAGVSVSTVSRVINNRYGVAEETSERVEQVINELGFTSSLAARSMRSHQTNVIGLVIPNITSSYAAALMRGVGQVIAQLDYDLVVYTKGTLRYAMSDDLGGYYSSLLNGSITDGLIVVTEATTSFSTEAPVVAIDPNHDSPTCPAIISTNREGALSAMNYLTDLGHRRIGFIAGPLSFISASRRLQGYKDGLDAAEIPFDENLVEYGDHLFETAIECAKNLLSLEHPPTAIFTGNDETAKGVYQVAEDAGIRIPEDLSVVGFDNLMDAAYLNPPLTTVDQFVSEMGTLAVEVLMKLIKGEDLENELHRIQTQLVVRDSCRALK